MGTGGSSSLGYVTGTCWAPASINQSRPSRRYVPKPETASTQHTEYPSVLHHQSKCQTCNKLALNNHPHNTNLNNNNASHATPHTHTPRACGRTFSVPGHGRSLCWSTTGCPPSPSPGPSPTLHVLVIVIGNTCSCSSKAATPESHGLVVGEQGQPRGLRAGLPVTWAVASRGWGTKGATWGRQFNDIVTTWGKHGDSMVTTRAANNHGAQRHRTKSQLPVAARAPSKHLPAVGEDEGVARTAGYRHDDAAY